MIPHFKGRLLEKELVSVLLLVQFSLSVKTYISTCWQLTPIKIESKATSIMMLAIACHLVQKLILGSKLARLTSLFFYIMILLIS
jgi:hypothetical protein